MLFINIFNLNCVILRLIFLYLKFLSEKVIEFFKVQENGCSDLFFGCIETIA